MKEDEVALLKARIAELEHRVKISQQTLRQYALIKRKHKEALDFLNSQKRFTASIIESSSHAVIAINHQKRVVLFNGAAERIFGYTKKEMLNKDTLHLIIPPKYYKDHVRAVDHFLKTGESIGIIGGRVELEGQRRDGTLFPVRIGFGVGENNGKRVIIANIEDITKERRQSQMMQQHNKLAAMGEMIGAIAHQWRQPLNTLATAVQNLELDYAEGLLCDEQYVKEFIQKNKQIIKFMSKTIDDFRSFVRIDTEKESFDVMEATQDVVNMLSAQLNHHGIKVSVRGESFLFKGYRSEFQQVIMNLLSNAKDALLQADVVEPTVTVTISKGKIEVCDNGGGIDESVLPRIFEPYFTTKKEQGTGLGLYMSKMFIEEHMGGTLEALNRGDNACFVIHLRVKDKVHV